MAVVFSSDGKRIVSSGADGTVRIWEADTGDEADKTKWKASPEIQARIKELRLKDENELQSRFIRQMDAFLTSHNRRLVGWDEILEGGLAENAVVMSWRGTAGGIAAARNAASARQE